MPTQQEIAYTRNHLRTLHLKSLIGMALQHEDIIDSDYGAACEIRDRGNPETIARMQKLLKSHNWRKRVLALFVMGQLNCYKNRDDTRTHARYGIEESKKMLVSSLDDSHPEVIDTALNGLAHTPVPSALPTMLKFVNHPDIMCRKQLAFALPHFINDSPHVTDVLLKLAADEYEMTRDWATHGLQYSQADTAEVRERLWINAHDEDIYVANEAMQGLARRKDPRVVELILYYAKNYTGFMELDNHYLIEIAELYDDANLLKTVQKHIEQKKPPYNDDSFTDDRLIVWFVSIMTTQLRKKSGPKKIKERYWMRRLNITPELKNLINTLRARLLRSCKILKRLSLSGIIMGKFATEDVFRKITQTLKQFADLTDSEFIAQREQIHNFLVQTCPFIADFRDHCKSSTGLNDADFFWTCCRATLSGDLHTHQAKSVA